MVSGHSVNKEKPETRLQKDSRDLRQGGWRGGGRTPDRFTPVSFCQGLCPPFCISVGAH